MKTAFIVRWPGKIQPGSSNRALLQYVDVVPTLIDIAGGNSETLQTGRKDANGHTGFDGRSFLSVMLNNQLHFRDYVYGVQTTLGIIGAKEPYPIRSIFDGQFQLIKNLNADVEFSNITKTRDSDLIQSWFKAGWKNPNVAYRAQFYYQRPPLEFYDVANDPNELHNLAGDLHYNEKINQLNEKLNSWMKQQGNEGIQTEMNANSRQPIRSN